MSFSPNGSFIIQRKIDQACLDGTRMTTVTGTYEIQSPIRIPSDFTLILSNCHLRMAPNTFCNMFVNASHSTEEGHTIGGTDRNITIQGVGRAILDGGEYNGLSEKNSGRDGLPHISVNNLLLFTNVDGFSIQNLHLRNQRWWAMNFIFCRNGLIRDIDFRADCRYVEEDGSITNHLGTFGKTKYDGIYVKNADGIDLRCGCHDILIENITGFTEDDTIALTALNGSTEALHWVDGLCPDIANVIIRNIRSSAYCANVRLLNQGGTRLHDILVDGVMDASKESPCMERGGYGVRVGDNHLYGSRHATADETCNIVVRNVFSRAAIAGLELAGAMSNCLFENILTFDDSGKAIKNTATVDVSSFIKN